MSIGRTTFLVKAVSRRSANCHRPVTAVDGWNIAMVPKAVSVRSRAMVRLFRAFHETRDNNVCKIVSHSRLAFAVHRLRNGNRCGTILCVAIMVRLVGASRGSGAITAHHARVKNYFRCFGGPRRWREQFV